jgi:hypothetical protein
MRSGALARLALISEYCAKRFICNLSRLSWTIESGGSSCLPGYPAASVLRRHIRGLVGCAVVFAVGCVIGILFGTGGGDAHPKPVTVVKVETTITDPSGGGSAAP